MVILALQDMVNLTWVWVNKLALSLRVDYRKYAVVFLATLIALIVVCKDFAHRVHTQELVSESILHLAAGNVYPSKKGFGSGTNAELRPGGGQSIPSDIRQNYIPPEATVIVTPKDPTKNLSDVVNVRIVDIWGIAVEPGLEGYIAPLGLGAGIKYFYYKKVGLTMGLDKFVSPVNFFSPSLGVSYRLDRYRILSNTELQLSYLPIGKIPVAFGIRIDLGN